MPRRPLLLLAAALAAATAMAFTSGHSATQTLGDTIVVAWNDLGMHCMNQTHATLSILPPFNNLMAQVIRRGDATHAPQLITQGVTVGYSVPGNTTSVTKTDFWAWAPSLFGVTLAPDVGLTGKSLSGSMDVSGAHFAAVGIPVTPWPDSDLVHEHPYQQALVVARDAQGLEIARSTPTIPVSTEINCGASGCHRSEQAILNSHPRVTGFDPNAKPVLCAKCHADPALGTTGKPEAGYFSLKMHDQHQFMDQTMSGTNECYMCHPGPKTQCLRGAMNQLHGQQCQNCHGNMAAMARGIENGRIPWVQEPSCASCHTAAYAENPNTLFKLSTGHGGVMCEGCHNSTHADVPSRQPEDNANNIALQGHAGPLGDCKVCHGVIPAGAGPHGITTAGVGDELLRGTTALHVSPDPMRSACTITLPRLGEGGGRLLVYDMQGRIVRMLEPAPGHGARVATWDARGRGGERVLPGIYFMLWQQAGKRAASRVTVLR